MRTFFEPLLRIAGPGLLLVVATQTASAQILSEDFTVDPGLIQTDAAPNDAADPDGDGSELGPRYNAQWNPGAYVDVHFDRGGHTGGRTDNESSLLAIGQTLTENDAFSFSLDLNLTFPIRHHIGYVGLLDSSVMFNQDPGHALFYLRQDALRFGLAQYHWEIASGLPLQDGVNYRLTASHSPSATDPWFLEVLNLDDGTVHWSADFTSTVDSFSLDLIGIAGWTDGAGEGVNAEGGGPPEIFGTSDNWVVTPEPSSLILLALTGLLARRR